MSLLVYPRFETVPLEARTDPSNKIYERTNQVALDPFRISAFSDFRAVIPSGISTYFWGADYPNVNSEFPTLSSEYQSTFDIERARTGAFQNIWLRRECPCSRLDFSLKPCKTQGISKSTELWRPFSPSPLEEICTSNSNSVVGSHRIYKTPHVITPSTVKIEASKTSLFKPVKKKKYACSYCTLIFSNGAQLKSHLRKHKGAKPYKCEYPNCLKSFARKEELTRHRRIHSGYKPYHCNVCGKSFCRKDHLSKHLKTHLQISEKKIYVCCVPGCEHRYTRSDALTRHKSTAHSLQKTSTDKKNKWNCHESTLL